MYQFSETRVVLAFVGLQNRLNIVREKIQRCQKILNETSTQRKSDEAQPITINVATLTVCQKNQALNQFSAFTF